MTVNEFKAFIEGIGVMPGYVPTVETWKKIEEKIALLENDPATTVINNVTVPESLRIVVVK